MGLGEVLARYRRHAAQVTNGCHAELFHYHTWRALTKFARHEYPHLRPELQKPSRLVLRRRLAEVALGIARAALARADRLSARRWLRTSLAADVRDPCYRAGLYLDTLLPEGAMSRLRRLKHRLVPKGGSAATPRAMLSPQPARDGRGGGHG
jgi:hypothetical protein